MWNYKFIFTNILKDYFLVIYFFLHSLLFANFLVNLLNAICSIIWYVYIASENGLLHTYKTYNTDRPFCDPSFTSLENTGCSSMNLCKNP